MDSLDRALGVLGDSKAPGRALAIRYLVFSDDDEVDSRLMSAFESFGRDVAVAATACRILAERDSLRDPEYALAWFDLGRASALRRVFQGFMLRNAYRYPWTCMFGVSRLVRADPLGHYRVQVESRKVDDRVSAVLALSDVPDRRALELVLPAFGDGHWRVRACAADAMRRFRFVVGEEAVLERAVPLLTEAVLDRRREVAVRAGRALARLGRGDIVAGAVAAVPVLQVVLDGVVAALPKSWEGEECEL